MSLFFGGKICLSPLIMFSSPDIKILCSSTHPFHRPVKRFFLYRCFQSNADFYLDFFFLEGKYVPTLILFYYPDIKFSFFLRVLFLFFSIRFNSCETASREDGSSPSPLQPVSNRYKPCESVFIFFPPKVRLTFMLTFFPAKSKTDFYADFFLAGKVRLTLLLTFFWREQNSSSPLSLCVILRSYFFFSIFSLVHQSPVIFLPLSPNVETWSSCYSTSVLIT